MRVAAQLTAHRVFSCGIKFMDIVNLRLNGLKSKPVSRSEIGRFKQTSCLNFI